MNKLINRISPETSENRILHAGFSIILMSEEITQTLSGLSSDMIIFILSGSITIYSTKEEKKTIGEQYMIFLRSFENYTYDITLGSKIIIFFFDSLTMNELPYYQHPYGILPQPISKWIELKIVEPLYTRVRDNILKSKEQKNIQPTKGGHKMVTCQNYVSLFYRQITSCPSDGGIS